jgi:threonylcarbamoyladenosine tRNA methylthiotransferase MtaB
MKRKYTTTLFSSRVEKIRATLPYACIAADVIVGFPGESEADFQTTYSFLEQLSISYMHVFTYSKRENTLASKAFEMVPRSQMKERSDLLHHLSDVKKQLFYQSNKGRKSAVLFESDNKNGMMHGFTENYIKVKTTFDPSLVNEIRSVRLEKLDDDLCYEVMG